MKIVHILLNFFLMIIVTMSLNVKAVEKKDLYVDEINLLPEYEVDLIWEKLEFTYVESDEYNFDKSNNEYVLNRSGSWVSTSNKIKVINNSNFAVNVTMKYQSILNHNNITGVFSNNNAIVESGNSFSTALYLNGTLEKSVNKFIKIGTITIEVI